MNERDSASPLLPLEKSPVSPGSYDIYPSFPAPSGSISTGFASLAAELAGLLAAGQGLALDGFPGVAWDELVAELGRQPVLARLSLAWVDARPAMRSREELDELLAPYLGGDDPLFGTRHPGSLRELFDIEQYSPVPAESDKLVTFGPGAKLLAPGARAVYFDLPKNEQQFRSRAGVPVNLGEPSALDPKVAYKRSYFVDWPLLSRHKAQLLEDLALYVDAQRDEPVFIRGRQLHELLDELTASPFRARPWFEPGVWGGQWMKDRFPGLPQDVPNFAWSFELISPENGVLLDDDNRLLEVSFDLLMHWSSERMLGRHAKRFGSDFPIRFDYLDTVGGGNLSLQCHPRPDYITSHFGETFTQDETYYILECTEDAKVYLGFQEGVGREEFERALRQSQEQGTPLEVESYVKVHDAERHDLFLIPSGTIHCSGRGNLVLEISATPYIFTFKLYDWQRPSSPGKPRPLNIDRGMDNLQFERQGKVVEEELLSRPRVVRDEEGVRVLHLPTHPDHFYDVQRLEFDLEIELATEDGPLVLNLVEGEQITVNGGSRELQVSYAETFVIPAAAKRCRLVNHGVSRAKVVVAYLKE